MNILMGARRAGPAVLATDFGASLTTLDGAGSWRLTVVFAVAFLFSRSSLDVVRVAAWITSEARREAILSGAVDDSVRGLEELPTASLRMRSVSLSLEAATWLTVSLSRGFFCTLEAFDDFGLEVTTVVAVPVNKTQLVQGIKPSTFHKGWPSRSREWHTAVCWKRLNSCLPQVENLDSVQ